MYSTKSSDDYDSGSTDSTHDEEIDNPSDIVLPGYNGLSIWAIPSPALVSSCERFVRSRIIKCILLRNERLRFAFLSLEEPISIIRPLDEEAIRLIFDHECHGMTSIVWPLRTAAMLRMYYQIRRLELTNELHSLIYNEINRRRNLSSVTRERYLFMQF